MMEQYGHVVIGLADIIQTLFWNLLAWKRIKSSDIITYIIPNFIQFNNYALNIQRLMV